MTARIVKWGKKVAGCVGHDNSEMRTGLPNRVRKSPKQMTSMGLGGGIKAGDINSS